ncbi:MAG: NTP transferase domain-containing protein [Candidatus Bathyarchaeota archaeon]|nr:NTP transferase domain-containing protein [Candidatus Bathyarchaeota archaeon]
MRIPALIMAGGKGKRMGLSTEKPLLPFLGKPLLDWVAQAVSNAHNISEFYVVTSPNTPQTQQHCLEKGYRILCTDAKGYHNDLKQATRQADLMDAVLTIPADLPAVTGEFIDTVVDAFEKCGKDFLAVFVPIKEREKLGLSISSTDEYQGIWYAVSGVNIINGTQIQTPEKIETSAIITQQTEVLLNINTTQDLQTAQKILQNQKRV